MVIVYDDGAGEPTCGASTPTCPCTSCCATGGSLRCATPRRRPASSSSSSAVAHLPAPRRALPRASSTPSRAAASLRAAGSRSPGVRNRAPAPPLDVPFDLAAAGTYTFRLDGVSARERPLRDPRRRRTAAHLGRLRPGAGPARDASARAPSPAGPTTFTARCVGKAPEAIGHLAVFDAFVAEPAAP